jgi:hypothetical protein
VPTLVVGAAGVAGVGGAASAANGGEGKGGDANANGAWLMPFYYTPDGYSKFAEHFSVMKISKDGGKSWSDHAMTAGLDMHA